MIGLYDGNIRMEGKKISPPNLEITKIARYHKEEGDYCKLITKDETNFSGYDKIYYYSDYNSDIPIPIRNFKNVEYGGMAFSKKKYKPIKNELIETFLPDLSIYKPILREFYKNGATPESLDDFLDSSYYRMYANDRELPMCVVNHKKKVYIYDYNIFDGKWEEKFKELAKRKCSTILTIYPVFCSSYKDFFKLKQMRKFNAENILCAPILQKNELEEIIKRNKFTMMSGITKSSNVFLPIGDYRNHSINYADDAVKEILIVIENLFKYWQSQIPMKVKFFQGNNFTYNPFSEIYTALERWSKLNTKRKINNSFLYYINRFSEKCRYEYSILENYLTENQKCYFKISYNTLTKI